MLPRVVAFFAYVETVDLAFGRQQCIAFQVTLFETERTCAIFLYIIKTSS